MIRSRALLLLLCLLACTTVVCAQAKKDSLWRVWHDESAPDTNRLKAIQALTWPLLSVDLDSAKLLATMQLEFAKVKNIPKWIARGYYNLGAHYYLKSDYALSEEYYLKSLEIRKSLDDKKGEAAIYGNLGLIYGDQGNSLKELEYQLKSLAINETLRDTDNLTSNYSNIAGIYQTQDDSTKALEYYNKALAMYIAQDKQNHIGLLYNNMGNLYRKYGLLDKAKYYLFESLRIRTELNDPLGLGITLINLGSLHITLKDYVKAREYTMQSIEQFTKLHDEASLANVYTNLGNISHLEGKYREAISWCKKSLDIARRTQKLEIEAANCSCLHKAHKALGEYQTALGYFEEYVVLDDSLKSDELKLAMSRLEIDKEILTDSIARVQEMNSLNTLHQSELRKRNQVTVLMLALGAVLLVITLLLLSRMLFFQRNTERLKRKTQELEKQQLVNEISLLKTQVNPHFLFNSLSILSSLVHIDPDLSEKFIDQLSKSYRYILEQKEEALVTLRTELNFIESYAFLLKIRFEKKFNLDIQIPDAVLDKYKIAPLTLQLLIENAVKHNRMSVTEPLIVTVSMDEENMMVVKNKLQPRAMEYKSTGVGLQNIKDRYALLTNRRVWTGEAEGMFVVKVPLLLCDQKFNAEV
jgi:tetratricopeptide (TPR) repeat protein